MTVDLTPLDYRTALTQVQRALLDRLSLAFQERRPPVRTVAELRQVEMVYVMHRDLVYVEDVGTCYRWLDLQDELDNNQDVIAPLNWTDSTGKTKSGRWVQCKDTTLYAPRGFDRSVPLNRIRTGYARSVLLYEGQKDVEDAFNRMFGRRPAMLLFWKRTRKKQLSTAPALYRAEYDFEVMGISYCPRYGPDAMFGSDLPEEAAGDPGLNQILGDASDCLLGERDATSGLGHILDAIDAVLPGEDMIIEESLGERLFLGATTFTVIAYLHRPDRDTERFRTLTSTMESYEQRGAPEPRYNNLVREGLEVLWPSAGLLAPIKPGSAVINGLVVQSAPPPWTFRPSSDTYLDLLPSGQMVFSPVDAGAEEPAVPDKALRVGVATTDAQQVVYFRYSAPTLIEVSGPDEIS